MIRFPHVILASSSPRRRALLEQIGVSFDAVPVDVDETPHDGEAPEVYVLRIALEKARMGDRARPPRSTAPVLGADTVVVSADGGILGKPRDRAEALDMLERLSGGSHYVLSGVAVVKGDFEVTRISASTVHFRDITEEERAAYWDTGEPRDKAGGYAIQGLGAVFVTQLEGSYSGVMGLPLYETAELLGEFQESPES